MPDALATELAALSRQVNTASADVKDLLTRIVSEIDFAAQLEDRHPEVSGAWGALIEDALAVMKKAVGSGKLDALSAAVGEAEKILAPLGETAKSYTIWCVGHGHIDMNWMWPWPETVSVTNDTFSTVERLMQAYPTFCYSQSQVSVYELTRVHNPALFEKIRRRVAEGRWEVTASMWVESDKNLPGGESLCRHLLYTRRFMEEHLGLRPADVLIDWEPDTFGHAHTIPSFLARAGVRRYYLCRGGADPKPAVFWWQAPDGLRVLCYREITWYNWTITPELIRHLMAFSKETGLRAWMNVYGVGDHGGGPTKENIDYALKMDSWPIFPNVTLSTTKPFYELLETNAEKWPVLNRELNFEFTGCYTTQTRIKAANRLSEQLLYQAEAASSLAWAQNGAPYPGERMREGWVNTIFSQFHDILPGSGVRETREYNRGQFQETAARAGMATTLSLRGLAEKINTNAVAKGGASDKPGDGVGAGAGYNSSLGAISAYDGAAHEKCPFVVFNLSGWERSEVVTAMLWNVGWSEIVADDDRGKSVAVQVLEKGNYWAYNYVKVAFPATKVPAMGYRTYVLREGQAQPAARKLANPAHGVVENEFIRVEMDWETGGVKRLVDRRTHLDLAVPGNPMGLLEYAVERHHGMTAWVIGDLQKRMMLSEFLSLDQRVGPYQATFTGRLKLNDSTITVQTIVRAGDPCVELVIHANWLERGYPEVGVPVLRLHVPVAVKGDSALYEIPYGTIRRTLMNGEEVPSQRWMDLSGALGDGEAGLTMLNDCKYGHSVDGSTMRLTLIRSSYDPDPLPEIGEHTIRVGLLPHGKAWAESDAIRAGVNFNQPLQAVGTDVHDGALPPSASYLSVDTQNVVLCALKKAEDSDALIIRLYETAGKETTATLALSPVLAGSSVVEVDLLERPLEGRGVSLKDGKLTVKVPAHGIASLMVRK